MKIRMLRDYDRFRAGQTLEVPEHLGRSLCRNEAPFACPANARAFAIVERNGEAKYPQLQEYAKALNISASGKKDELREAILEVLA